MGGFFRGSPGSNSGHLSAPEMAWQAGTLAYVEDGEDAHKHRLRQAVILLKACSAGKHWVVTESARDGKLLSRDGSVYAPESVPSRLCTDRAVELEAQSTQAGKPRWLTPPSNAFLIHIS